MIEQKKGSYKYFMDLGDRLEVVEPKTAYIDEVRETKWQIYCNC